MGVQHALIIELDQLVLAAATHGNHAGSGQRAPLLRCDVPDECRVMQLEGDDPATDEVPSEGFDRAFDFRKFGHVRLTSGRDTGKFVAPGYRRNAVPDVTIAVDGSLSVEPS
jgi:hypothetical protein